MIDFDNPGTYPNEIKDWVLSNMNLFMSMIPEGRRTEGWQIAHILDDMRLGEYQFVLDFINVNSDMEFCVWHTTRIEHEEQFWKNGIVVISNDTNLIMNRYKALLLRIGLKEIEIAPIFKKMEYYWHRDTKTRIEMVHFFFPRTYIKDPRLNIFAINLGGEILRWALRDIDPELYKTEPYKRLWIWGKPCIIKFKCKLKDMNKVLTQKNVIVEIVKYFVITELFKLTYDMNCDGKRIGSVAPEDILAIELIENYIKMQEEFDEFNGFYEELK